MIPPVTSSKLTNELPKFLPNLTILYQCSMPVGTWPLRKWKKLCLLRMLLSQKNNQCGRVVFGTVCIVFQADILVNFLPFPGQLDLGQSPG